MAKRSKLKKPAPPPAEPMNEDDEELMNDLVAQMDNRDQNVQAESANVLNDMQLNKQAAMIESTQKPDPKSRFKARQARKAAALAQSHAPIDPEADARLQKEAEAEERIINKICDGLGLQIHQIEPDGHCLYAAIADQLALLSILPSSQANYGATRLAASSYIYTHPDDFLPFLPCDDNEGKDGLMSPQQFENYCISIRDTGVWGGEPEILALSRAYNVPIHVVQSGSPSVVVHDPSGSPVEQDVRDKKVARISYHRKMYGLGEHYNSLRPKSHLSRLTSTITSVLV